MKNRLLALGTALVLTASLTAPAFAAETDDNGIAVQLDGQNITFTDVAPEAHSGRTFLPFRAVLEAMGAEVDYKADTQTVVAVKDGTTLEMTIGDKQSKITEGEETSTLDMDVAAYAKNNRTYVPVRFAAEAFGCNVGWDQDNQTVIIVDVDKLMGDSTYELLDNYNTYTLEQTSENNQAIKGDMSLQLDISKEMIGTTADVSLPITADISGLSTLTATQMEMSMNLSKLIDAMIKLTPELDATEIADMKAALGQIDMEIRLDLETGMYYINCPVLSTLTTGEASDNTWYSMDMNALFSSVDMGIDLKQLMDLSQGSSKDTLTTTLSLIPLNDKDTSYAVLAQTAQIYRDMCSAQAFTKSGNNYTSTLSMTEDGITTNIKTVLTGKGNDIVGMKMTMDMSATDEDFGAISFNMDMSATTSKTTMTMEMNFADMLSLDMAINMTTSATSKSPETTLPADAVVVPLNLFDTAA